MQFNTDFTKAKKGNFVLVDRGNGHLQSQSIMKIENDTLYLDYDWAFSAKTGKQVWAKGKKAGTLIENSNEKILFFTKDYIYCNP